MYVRFCPIAIFDFTKMCDLDPDGMHKVVQRVEREVRLVVKCSRRCLISLITQLFGRKGQAKTAEAETIME